jgi:hypothetical protein
VAATGLIDVLVESGHDLGELLRNIKISFPSNNKKNCLKKRILKRNYLHGLLVQVGDSNTCSEDGVVRVLGGDCKPEAKRFVSVGAFREKNSRAVESKQESRISRPRRSDTA